MESSHPALIPAPALTVNIGQRPVIRAFYWPKKDLPMVIIKKTPLFVVG